MKKYLIQQTRENESRIIQVEGRVASPIESPYLKEGEYAFLIDSPTALKSAQPIMWFALFDSEDAAMEHLAE